MSHAFANISNGIDRFDTHRHKHIYIHPKLDRVRVVGSIHIIVGHCRVHDRFVHKVKRWVIAVGRVHGNGNLDFVLNKVGGLANEFRSSHISGRHLGKRLIGTLLHESVESRST